MNVWYLLMCNEKCVVTQQKVNSPKGMKAFSAVLWSADGAFFILDVYGNIYIVSDNKVVLPFVGFKSVRSVSFVWHYYLRDSILVLL